MSTRIIKWFSTSEEMKEAANKFIDENFDAIYESKFKLYEVCITLEMS